MYKCVARWIENWDSVKKSSIIAELLIQDKCLVSYYCILYLIQGVLIIQKMGNPLLKIQCKVQTFNLLFAIFDRKSNHFKMLRFDIPIVKMLYLVSILLDWNGLFNRLWWIFYLISTFSCAHQPEKGSPLGRASSASCWILLWWTTWGGHAKTMSLPPTPPLIFFSPKHGMKKEGEKIMVILKKKMLVEATPHSESHCGFQDFKF